VTIASAVRRDRAILLGGLVVVTGLAWAHMAGMAAEPGGAHGCHHGIAVAPWSARDLATAAAMWGVMMTGMMLPVVSPWVLALSGTARERDPRAAPFGTAGFFLGGYGAVWLGYSVLAAAGQLALQRAALLSPRWTTTSPWVAAGLLALAGAYQLTPLRDACMAHCRSPFGFFLSSWREGRWGAFTMGARHGISCVGCCWALMALSFVFGVMSLLWMALVTAFLLLEKATSAGPWMSKTAGIGLLAGAVWMVGGMR
jgi:predicted metal-binding membrane protein